MNRRPWTLPEAAVWLALAIAFAVIAWPQPIECMAPTYAGVVVS